jgi:hypothetical protein
MKDIWTRHLSTPEDKEQFRKSISRQTVKRLDDIVGILLNDLEKSEISPKNYDTPNWAYKQAHSNGYKQAMSTIKSILDLGE